MFQISSGISPFLFMVGKSQSLGHLSGHCLKKTAHLKDTFLYRFFFSCRIGSHIAFINRLRQIVFQIFSSLSYTGRKIMVLSSLPGKNFKKHWPYHYIKLLHHIGELFPPQTFCHIIQTPPEFIADCQKFFLGRFLHPVYFFKIFSGLGQAAGFI